MKKLAAMVVVPLVLLTGCSGEPSEADIEKVVKSTWQEQMESMAGMFGLIAGKDGQAEAKDLADPVKSVKKIGCNEDGKNAYLCDVEVEMSMAGNLAKETDRIRMIKSSNGWTMGGK